MKLTGPDHLSKGSTATLCVFLIDLTGKTLSIQVNPDTLCAELYIRVGAIMEADGTLERLVSTCNAEIEAIGYLLMWAGKIIPSQFDAENTIRKMGLVNESTIHISPKILRLPVTQRQQHEREIAQLLLTPFDPEAAYSAYVRSQDFSHNFWSLIQYGIEESKPNRAFISEDKIIEAVFAFEALGALNDFDSFEKCKTILKNNLTPAINQLGRMVNLLNSLEALWKLEVLDNDDWMKFNILMAHNGPAMVSLIKQAVALNCNDFVFRQIVQIDPTSLSEVLLAVKKFRAMGLGNDAFLLISFAMPSQVSTLITCFKTEPVSDLNDIFMKLADYIVVVGLRRASSYFPPLIARAEALGFIISQPLETLRCIITSKFGKVLPADAEQVQATLLTVLDTLKQMNLLTGDSGISVFKNILLGDSQDDFEIDFLDRSSDYALSRKRLMATKEQLVGLNNRAGLLLPISDAKQAISKHSNYAYVDFLRTSKGSFTSSLNGLWSLHECSLLYTEDADTYLNILLIASEQDAREDQNVNRDILRRIVGRGRYIREMADRLRSLGLFGGSLIEKAIVEALKAAVIGRNFFKLTSVTQAMLVLQGIDFLTPAQISCAWESFPALPSYVNLTSVVHYTREVVKRNSWSWRRYGISQDDIREFKRNTLETLISAPVAAYAIFWLLEDRSDSESGYVTSVSIYFQCWKFLFQPDFRQLLENHLKSEARLDSIIQIMNRFLDKISIHLSYSPQEINDIFRKTIRAHQAEQKSAFMIRRMQEFAPELISRIFQFVFFPVPAEIPAIRSTPKGTPGPTGGDTLVIGRNFSKSTPVVRQAMSELLSTHFLTLAQISCAGESFLALPSYVNLMSVVNYTREVVRRVSWQQYGISQGDIQEFKRNTLETLISAPVAAYAIFCLLEYVSDPENGDVKNVFIYFKYWQFLFQPDLRRLLENHVKSEAHLNSIRQIIDSVLDEINMQLSYSPQEINDILRKKITAHQKEQKLAFMIGTGWAGQKESLKQVSIFRQGTKAMALAATSDHELKVTALPAATPRSALTSETSSPNGDHTPNFWRMRGFKRELISRIFQFVFFPVPAEMPAIRSTPERTPGPTGGDTFSP